MCIFHLLVGSIIYGSNRQHKMLDLTRVKNSFTPEEMPRNTDNNYFSIFGNSQQFSL